MISRKIQGNWEQGDGDGEQGMKKMSWPCL